MANFKYSLYIVQNRTTLKLHYGFNQYKWFAVVKNEREKELLLHAQLVNPISISVLQKRMKTLFVSYSNNNVNVHKWEILRWLLKLTG